MTVDDTLLLKPSEIRFTQDSISKDFNRDGSCHSLFLNIKNGATDICKIPKIHVAEHNGKFYSSNNRRLYVYRALEYEGIITQIQVKKIKYRDINKRHDITSENDGVSIKIRGSKESLLHSIDEIKLAHKRREDRRLRECEDETRQRKCEESKRRRAVLYSCAENEQTVCIRYSTSAATNDVNKQDNRKSVQTFKQPSTNFLSKECSQKISPREFQSISDTSIGQFQLITEAQSQFQNTKWCIEKKGDTLIGHLQQTPEDQLQYESDKCTQNMNSNNGWNWVIGGCAAIALIYAMSRAEAEGEMKETALLSSEPSQSNRIWGKIFGSISAKISRMLPKFFAPSKSDEFSAFMLADICCSNV